MMFLVLSKTTMLKCIIWIIFYMLTTMSIYNLYFHPSLSEEAAMFKKVMNNLRKYRRISREGTNQSNQLTETIRDSVHLPECKHGPVISYDSLCRNRPCSRSVTGRKWVDFLDIRIGSLRNASNRQ